MNFEERKRYPLKDYYSKIHKKYDLINRLFTFGLDRKWRKAAASICLSSHPRKVMDLCCGTGDMAIEIALLCESNVEIKGYDFSEQMLSIAKKKVQKRKLKNIDFVQGDAAKIPFGNTSFDCITIAFGFRNLCYENPEYKNHFQEMNRVLKDKGKVIILESGIPSNSLVWSIYKVYLSFILIPLGGIISGNWKAYKYLAKSSGDFYDATKIDCLLREFNFKLIQERNYLLGAANLFIAEKQGE